ncbi:uncharacterized protein LOC100370374 [Saccoglossus kowalevskii]|uniref:Uncharacterized protein LOC100370374 n=1 Tax=Saccoglossus kowalevskii TaxID=10224 RepID=A0ABM0GU63_SACKO|nr:PREDICTED: uncharacterized protein LOC100370374 [Saccoglossus kowalevskii]
MLLPAKYIFFTAIFIQQYAHIQSFKLSKSDEIEQFLNEILKEKVNHVTTEEEAWDFFGVPRCKTGDGLQCFPGTPSSQCFSGIDDTCNGVVDCNCDGACTSPDDESPEACQLREQVVWIIDNGIPYFGFGKHDSEIFTVLWFMGLHDYCPTHSRLSKSSLICPAEPHKCISIDKFCDGFEHCSSLCYDIQGYNFCGTNHWLGGCLIKDTMATVTEGTARK